MIAAACLFWFALAVVVYTYFGYPVLIALAAKLFPRPVARSKYLPNISVVLAGYNEAKNLEARFDNLLAQDYPADKFDIVAVSDGSTDESGVILRRRAASMPERIKALILEKNGGKAVALNAGLEAATGELIVFADARQAFAPDVLRRLAENFADPRVGSASGELVLLEADGGVAANVGLYWKYEKWMRRNESVFGSMLGATGAIYAIRRALYRPLPPGTLLDDFLTPMRIVLDGHRAIFDGRAIATDRASTKGGQEFKRKVRTLAGNFQAFALEPGLLLPWRNPATWWQLWSHKALRLVVPWALVVMLLASAAAPGRFYTLAAVAQALFYGLAFAGWLAEKRGGILRWKPVGLAYTFVTLNVAAAAGFIHWLRGGRGLWRKAY